MKALIALASLALFATPVQATYEYEVDRFTGTKTATYTQYGDGCVQTKGLHGKAHGCLFINSTESAAYPVINVWKINPSWELLRTAQRSGSASAIVTMTNGQVVRTKIPTKLTTRVSRGSVSEWVSLRLGQTKLSINRIKVIEVQYGSAEFRITPNKQAMCALNRAEACNS
jgi:hypothetical protein